MKTTIYKVAEPILEIPASGHVVPRQKRDSIVKGINPKTPPLTEGVHMLTPEEAAGMLIDPLTIKSAKTGYQRQRVPTHARKIAKAQQAGFKFPVVEYAIYTDPNTGKKVAEVVDGQHRLLGTIISGVPSPAVGRIIEDEQERKQLFVDQRKAAFVNREYTIFASDLKCDEFLVDAVLRADDDPKTPWTRLVGIRGKTGTRAHYIPITTAREMIASYVLQKHTHGAAHDDEILQRLWNEMAADELAELVGVFGTKASNPLAFSSHALRGITYCAIACIRKQGSSEADVERWKRHMPSFQFTEYAHLRKSGQIRDMLITHWNKRLRGKNRIPVGFE